MVRSWCMRYEAKHSYFKRLAAYMGNFTNVALSLGERHQTRSCYLMSAQCGGNASPLAKKPKLGKFMKLHLVIFFAYRYLIKLIISV